MRQHDKNTLATQKNCTIPGKGQILLEQRNGSYYVYADDGSESMFNNQHVAIELFDAYNAEYSDDNYEYLGKRICPETAAIIELWNTYKRKGSRLYLYYRLTHENKVIFEGDDFSPSPLDDIDSDATFGSILGFLSLRKGGADDDYFKDYTEMQMEWVDQYAELVDLYAMELSGELDNE